MGRTELSSDKGRGENLSLEKSRAEQLPRNRNMTVKETIEMFKGEFADVEVYEDKFQHNAGFHTDRITVAEDYSEDSEVIGHELMDETEYQNTIMANVSDSADFATWYGDKNAKVLVLKIQKERGL